MIILKGQQGSTLIESMIVLVIMGLLWTTALGSLSQVTSRINVLVCRMRCQSIEQSAALARVYGEIEATGFKIDNDAMTCPDGGVYEISVDDQGIVRVKCSIHKENLASPSPNRPRPKP